MTVATRAPGRPPTVLSVVADLEDDVAALWYERERIGTEVRALARRIELAIRADRSDIAMHVAGRLDGIAASLLRRNLPGDTDDAA